MAGRLTLQERAQIAARYEVWGCIVQVQRWWRTIKGKHAQIDPKTIKNCHKKLMTTGSVVILKEAVVLPNPEILR